MRLLVDENLSRRVAVLPAKAGHDAVHVGDLGMLGADDEKVLETAAAQERTLVTADTDFGAMLALTGSSEPSVLLLRGPGRRAEQRAMVILTAIEASAGRSRQAPSSWSRSTASAYEPFRSSCELLRLLLPFSLW